ncbi:MAG: sensor histidine kinase [Inhella sp.]|jgi:signal transduction histidine kinase|uniref:sensor histidine kinase n=1 Tax=Inhella sp. TaxID=1921806 RepID=UPI00391AACC5
MKRLPSIVGELAWIVGAGALAGALALGVAALSTVHDEVDELLDDALRASAEGLAPLVARLPRPSQDEPPTVHQAGHFAWVLLDARGAVRQHSAGADASPLLSHAPRVGFSDLPNWRVYGLAVSMRGDFLLVAQAREERHEARDEVFVNVGMTCLAVALVVLPLLVLRTRRALRPLEALSERLAQVEPDRLQQGLRLGPPERSELAPVHEALESLGQRLAQRLQFERAFAAQAAHLLRTPLAGIDAQLAVALKEHPELQRLAQVRAATTRLQRLVLALLRLFRTQPEVQAAPLDARALLRELLPPGLELVDGPAVPVRADAELLAAALLNLVDNAQRHGGCLLRLQASGPNGLLLQDDGLGVSDAERHAILAALDNHTDQEHRLGLRLADLVARAHGGRLLLPPALPGQGFTVQLELSESPELLEPPA